MKTFLKKPVFEVRKAILNKEIKIEEYINLFLNNIKEKEKDINSLIQIFEKESLEQARFFDQNLEKYKDLKLLGIPVIVKDNIQIEGCMTTIASFISNGYKAPFSATIVKKLKEAGAIIIGKSNLDEMAMGSTNRTSYFQPVKNPHHLEYVPGGSSGGSTAAVYAGFAPIALGTDTGGSIRQPAAWCGVIGLKPTYGRISRYGVVSYASSLDVVGPIARSVEDIAYVMDIVSGFDPMDLTSAENTSDSFFKDIDKPIKKKLKIALIKEYDSFYTENYKKHFHKLLQFLESQGFEIEYVSMPEILLVAATYFILAVAEANSNFARFSGINYPYRDLEKNTIEEMIISNRSKGFGIEVKKRLCLGNHFLQKKNYSEYLRCQEIRIMIQDQFDDVFKKFDFILCPTASVPAFKINDVISNEDSYNLDQLTIGANYAGIPAISLPFYKEQNNMPMAVQIVGNRFNEKELLQLSFNIFNYIKSKNEI